MPYPLEDRFKNLQEQVSNQQEPSYDGHPIEDKVFHGVVKEVIKDSMYTFAWIKVCPYDPNTPLDQAGDLVFETVSQDPLRNTTTSTRYDKVYCINLAPQLAFAYFQPGQRITYWHYSGTGANTALIRGTYVTLWAGPNEQLVKVSSNATGSGLYNGRIMTGNMQISPSADLALPSTMVTPMTDNCLLLNPLETGTVGSHSLTAGSYYVGILTGSTTTSPGDPSLPVYTLVIGVPPGTGQYKVLMILDTRNPGTIGWDFPRFY
jgi:hypothetical protein